MSFDRSGTFAYSPDIQVSIYTQKQGAIDVSRDIVDFSINRQTNAVSNFSCTLSNPLRKYNQVINTMDRIVVFLKRTSWLQAFTGYVTMAPIETLVPTPVTIQASCTLYQLQNTYWDDTLVQFQQLLLNASDSAAVNTDALINDGGIVQATVNVLKGVAGWNPSRIHVQNIPSSFVKAASSAYNFAALQDSQLDQTAVTQLATLLGAAGVINGNPVNSYSNNALLPLGAPNYVTFNANSVSPMPYLISSPSQSSPKNLPGLAPVGPVNTNKDIYWCAAHWAYLDLPGSGTSTISGVQAAQKWLAGTSGTGQYLYVANTTTGSGVVLRATSVPEDYDGNYDSNFQGLQVHPTVFTYLGGELNSKLPPPALQTYTPITTLLVQWADPAKVSGTGPQNLTTPQVGTAQSELGVNPLSSGTVTPTELASAAVSLALKYVGANYSELSNWRENAQTSAQQSSFDCSGFVNFIWKQVLQKDIGSYTGAQWGTPPSPSPAGIYIANTSQPQPGDLLYWQAGGSAATIDSEPSHVTMLVDSFGSNGTATQIGDSYSAGSDSSGTTLINGKPDGWNASSNGKTTGVTTGTVKWTLISGGGNSSTNGMGMYYMGARRPVSLSSSYNASTQNVTISGVNGTAIDLTNSFNFLLNPPNVNPLTQQLQGTPQAFIMDNSLLSDLQNIVGAGLRSFMSAPNGDFVAWFPDYYGVYGTTPALEISDVEIIDFEIYHDDSQLATHVAVVGDTNGVGQQVISADYLTSQGIVSIQDNTTLNLLFGTLGIGPSGVTAAKLKTQEFLNKYGMRPYVVQQQMIHSHELEYLYALQTFMQKWASQYASQVNLTFMPELYPGMRVIMNLSDENGVSHQYQLYCMNVQHQGSRAGGFTTQATFTGIIKDGNVLDYGLSLFGNG